MYSGQVLAHQLTLHCSFSAQEFVQEQQNLPTAGRLSSEKNTSFGKKWWATGIYPNHHGNVMNRKIIASLCNAAHKHFKVKKVDMCCPNMDAPSRMTFQLSIINCDSGANRFGNTLAKSMWKWAERQTENRLVTSCMWFFSDIIIMFIHIPYQFDLQVYATPNSFPNLHLQPHRHFSIRMVD